MSVATFKMGFLSTLFKIICEMYIFQCRPFWIANCSPNGQIPRRVPIVLKSAYQHYPINQCHDFIHLNNPIIYVL